MTNHPIDNPTNSTIMHLIPTTPMTTPKSKHNVWCQYGKGLSAKFSAQLEADPRIASYHTEQNYDGDRIICIELAKGYNYEGRMGFITADVAETKQFLKNIEVGEPDDSDDCDEDESN